MATFEDLKLVFQSHTNFENLRRDMRQAAQAYLDAVAENRPVATIVGTIASGRGIVSQNNQSQIRLGWALSAWNDLAIRAKIQSGLGALSLLQSELTGTYTELKNAADAEKAIIDAGITTYAQIQALANATLANVAAHVSIWPAG